MSVCLSVTLKITQSYKENVEIVKKQTRAVIYSLAQLLANVKCRTSDRNIERYQNVEGGKMILFIRGWLVKIINNTFNCSFSVGR